jgi:hypothetical protein
MSKYPKDIEVWYRVEVQGYNDHEFDIHYVEYRVINHTPKGVWLKAYDGKRFVTGNCRKQLALPTKQLALRDFIFRKKAHIRHLEIKYRMAHNAMHYAETEFQTLFDPDRTSSLAEIDYH